MLAVIFIPKNSSISRGLEERMVHMAKAKYTKNSRGEYETKIWDGTYNVDGSKHRKRLVSRKSSADLERQVNQLKSEVENGQYVQNTDVTFLEYARSWLKTKKPHAK